MIKKRQFLSFSAFHFGRVHFFHVSTIVSHGCHPRNVTHYICCQTNDILACKVNANKFTCDSFWSCCTFMPICFLFSPWCGRTECSLLFHLLFFLFPLSHPFVRVVYSLHVKWTMLAYSKTTSNYLDRNLLVLRAVSTRLKQMNECNTMNLNKCTQRFLEKKVQETWKLCSWAWNRRSPIDVRLETKWITGDSIKHHETTSNTKDLRSTRSWTPWCRSLQRSKLNNKDLNWTPKSCVQHLTIKCARILPFESKIFDIQWVIKRAILCTMKCLKWSAMSSFVCNG